MHGLNTRQELAFLSPMTGSPQAGVNVQKTFNVESVDDPASLNFFLFLGESNSQRQYYVKRMYNRYFFTNLKPYPCFAEFLWIKARHDIPNNAGWPDVATAVYAIMNDLNSAVGVQNPVISNTTGPYFHKWFKILRKKSFTMKPGVIYKLRHKASPHTLNRPLQQGVEGDSSDYVIRKGQTLFVHQFYGVPVFTSGAGGAGLTNTTFSDFAVTGMVHYYASWYNMDDADTTNSLIYNPETTRAVELQGFYPSCYSHQYVYPTMTTNNYVQANPTAVANYFPYTNQEVNYLHTVIGASSNPVHTITP